MKIEMIYEDNDIIVCHKPAGVATQTKKIGQQDMVSFLRNYRAKKKEEPYIGVVHRLDQPVEGVMVFAKNQQAASNISKQVAQRTIGKHYYAVVWTNGQELEKKGVLEDYMQTDQKANISRVVPEGTRDAKFAKLQYEVRATYMDRAIVDIELHTGRQHQIRLQFASRGCPLLGDNKYGEGQDGYKKIALCSYKLEFKHPTTGNDLTYEIPWNGAYFIDIVPSLDYDRER